LFDDPGQKFYRVYWVLKSYNGITFYSLRNLKGNLKLGEKSLIVVYWIELFGNIV
jgi:hypothetical protein